MGSRRGFICRMRLGNINPSSLGYMNRVRQRNMLRGSANPGTTPSGQPADGSTPTGPGDFTVVHCTGYIKNWPPSGLHHPHHGGHHEDPHHSGGHDGLGGGGSSCCLVAIGRLQVTSMPNSHDMSGGSGVESQQEFVSRHSMEGKFTFCDQRVINLMGYTPQELLGKSCFDLIHAEDQGHMKESFDQVVKMKGQVMNFMYRFRAKSGDWVWLRTTAFAFLNPYTDDMEYVVCTNSTNAKGGSSNPANPGGTTASSAAAAVAAAAAASAAVNTSNASVVPPQPPSAASSDEYRPSVSTVTSSGVAPGGLDYSIGRTSASDYTSHLSQAAAVAAAAASASTYSYDTSPAANYGGQRASSVGGKTSAGTPTPPQSAWNANVSEGYHYSNLSPSRSPSGYPRTASAASAVSPAAAVSSMWQHWQGNGQELHHAGHPVAPGHPPPPHQPHHVHAAAAAAGQHTELGDMLSMLGQNAAAAGHHHPSAVGFASAAENLGGMFTGQFQ